MPDDFNFSENFFDLHDASNNVMEFWAVEAIFVRRLKIFLTSAYGLPESSAKSIAKTLFARMSDPALHYHTPVHVLAMLDFAKVHNIELCYWERLAIWFHDAVYKVGAAHTINEQCSANFMEAMMTPFVPDATILDPAKRAIINTALHLEKDVPKLYRKVLDLDMAGFSWPRSMYCKTTQALRKEYDVDDATFNNGRKQFLTQLIGKGKIYRSAEFQSRFEHLAQANIKEDLAEIG